jgi:hypothetical protein
MMGIVISRIDIPGLVRFNDYAIHDAFGETLHRGVHFGN